MKVTFYTNTADDKRVDKTKYLINPSPEIDFIFKETASKDNPIIIIQMSNEVALPFLKDKNYCYIKELNSYYFIRQVDMMSAKREAYHLDLDVLMTNRNEIRNMRCIIRRQSSRYDNYLIDEQIKIKENKQIEVHNFPTGLTGHDTYILAVAGKIVE